MAAGQGAVQTLRAGLCIRPRTGTRRHMLLMTMSLSDPNAFVIPNSHRQQSADVLRKKLAKTKLPFRDKILDQTTGASDAILVVAVNSAFENPAGVILHP